MSDYAGKVGKPVQISNLSDAQKKLGHFTSSDKWDKYTLCEAVAAHFANTNGNVGPIYVVNVLDPANHQKTANDTSADAAEAVAAAVSAARSAASVTASAVQKAALKATNTAVAKATVKPVASTAIALGDIVQFKGGPHYVSSTATSYSVKPKAGPAKVTAIAKSARHPYHVIHTNSQSTVYGWVDASLISK